MSYLTLLFAVDLLLVGGLVFFLVFPTLLWVFSFFKRKVKARDAGPKAGITCIITVYQNLELSANLAKSILSSAYANFEVIIIADDCEGSQLDLADERLRVIYPPAKLGSKVKSIQLAMDHADPNNELAVVLDPDNLVHPEYLDSINNYFQLGYEAIQGKRTAKNLNTDLSKLDALGETYYNYTDRYLTFKIGSSATIAGSGMAIATACLREFLSLDMLNRQLETGVILGEDKLLQNFLVSRGTQIAYAPNAIVYDEKITTGKQVERQRTRWINTYLVNLKDAGKILYASIKKLDFNAFVFGIITIRPPLFILGLSSLAMIIVNLFFSMELALTLLSALVVFFITFVSAIVVSRESKNLWALVRLPWFIFFQVVALFKTKKHKNDFLATKNDQFVGIEEVLKK